MNNLCMLKYIDTTYNIGNIGVNRRGELLFKVYLYGDYYNLKDSLKYAMIICKMCHIEITPHRLQFLLSMEMYADNPVLLRSIYRQSRMGLSNKRLPKCGVSILNKITGTKDIDNANLGSFCMATFNIYSLEYRDIERKYENIDNIKKLIIHNKSEYLLCSNTEHSRIKVLKCLGEKQLELIAEVNMKRVCYTLESKPNVQASQMPVIPWNLLPFNIQDSDLVIDF